MPELNNNDMPDVIYLHSTGQHATLGNSGEWSEHPDAESTHRAALIPKGVETDDAVVVDKGELKTQTTLIAQHAEYRDTLRDRAIAAEQKCEQALREITCNPDLSLIEAVRQYKANHEAAEECVRELKQKNAALEGFLDHAVNTISLALPHIRGLDDEHYCEYTEMIRRLIERMAGDIEGHEARTHLAQQDQPAGEANDELPWKVVRKSDGEVVGACKQCFGVDAMMRFTPEPYQKDYIIIGPDDPSHQPAGEWITINEDGSNLPDHVPGKNWMVVNQKGLQYETRGPATLNWPRRSVVAYYSEGWFDNDRALDIPAYTARKAGT